MRSAATILCVLFLSLFQFVSLTAQIPNTLNYQGLLTDNKGKPVDDDIYTITVRIYKTPTGGTPVYTETLNSVQTTDGFYNIIIGKNTPLNLTFDEVYWLGITVGTGGEFTPRTEFTSVPYAQKAKNADKASISDGLSNTATGVVKSVNSADGAITLEGGGGTTINRTGQTITITAPGGTGTGIQGVQNSDGNLSITNPNGPTATINISNTFSKPPTGPAGGDLKGNYPNPIIDDGKVTTVKISDRAITNSKVNDVAWNKISGVPASFPPTGPAGGDLTGTYPNPLISDGKVTTAKIADGAITTPKIADTAVTNAKIKDVAWGKITGVPSLGAKKIDDLTDGKTDTTSVFLGDSSGINDDGSNYNTAVGIKTLYSNTWGYENTAFGDFSLYSNTYGGDNTSIGHRCLYSNTTGNSNTAIGSLALHDNTTGSDNTATGLRCLSYNTNGVRNTANGIYALLHNATGAFNTASGAFSLSENTIGSFNTAYGYISLNMNITGNYNTAIGEQVMRNNTTGSSNVSVGACALYKNTDRSNLVAIGDSALYNNGTGATDVNHAAYNTAIGSKAMFGNTTGFSNTATGYYAMKNNLSGSDNAAFGVHSMESNTNGIYNSSFGAWSLNQNTTGKCNTAIGLNALRLNITGSNNTAVGQEALCNDSTGSYNTAIGNQALINNKTGSNNIAIGNGALALNTNRGNLVAIGDSALFKNGSGTIVSDQGKFNTAVGSKSLLSNTSGEGNTAIGYGSLYDNTTSTYNTAIGYIALAKNMTGNSNVAIGTAALARNETGWKNTAIGENSLSQNTTGSKTIAIGSEAGYRQTTGSNNIYISNSGYSNDTNIIRIGEYHNKCYISGIYNSTSNVEANVAINTYGQLMRSSNNAGGHLTGTYPNPSIKTPLALYGQPNSTILTLEQPYINTESPTLVVKHANWVYSAEFDGIKSYSTDGVLPAGRFETNSATIQSPTLEAIARGGTGACIYGSHAGNSNAGYFRTTNSGNANAGVYISVPYGRTGLASNGSKSAVVKTNQGARLMYCEESSEIWFSDHGFGKLVNGEAIITIEPLFAETVNLNEKYHVFMQVRGNAQIYVSDFTTTNFKVKLISGDANVEFSYKILAKRKGYEGERLLHYPYAEDDNNLYPEKKALIETGH